MMDEPEQGELRSPSTQLVLTQELGPRPWEQLPGESDAEYARFLIYLNLGPSRNLIRAYKHYLGGEFPPGLRKAPGSYREEARRWDWRRRAERTDVIRLREAALSLAPQFVEVLKTGMLAALRGFRSCKIENASDLIDLVNALAAYASPDLLASAAREASLPLKEEPG